jgi:hypothetical protein
VLETITIQEDPPMFRKLITMGLVVVIVAALAPANVFARQGQTVQVTLWNGEGRAWRYYQIDNTTSVELYYYWFAQTEQQVQDFITHADFDITVDGQALFASQAEVDAQWRPIQDFNMKARALKRAEWSYTLPPMAPGEHVIRTIITTDVALEDGVFAQPYPAGTMHNTTNVVTVIAGVTTPVISPVEPQPTAAARPGAASTEIHDKAVVGTFVKPAQAFWAPDDNKPVDPPITFAPGMTLWVFGMDSTYSYYKVVLDAAYLWVHADTLGTTNDGVVWHNDPLPNVVVQ